MKRSKFGVIVFSAVLMCLLCTAPVRAQDVVANPDTYDFFTVYIGDSETMTGSLENHNGGTVFITDWEWTYNPLGAFEVTSGLTLPAPIGSGESVDYQVTFTPPDFSFWNARLMFYTDSLTTPSVEVRFWGFGDYPPPDPCFPLTDCGGVCVDTSANIDNCGTCGNVCQAPVGGSATCDLGVCGTDCSGLTDCGGVCLDLVNDVDNCGACGNVCPDPVGGSAVCLAGDCANDCGALTDCGGVCMDTYSDIDNCGACGNICTAPDNGSAICVTGICDFECDPGYIPDGEDCVPYIVDPRILLEELLQLFDDEIADGNLEGTARSWWVRIIQIYQMRRHLVRAIREYDRGRFERVCFRLDRAYLRTDGMRSPRDFVEGPAADELADEVLNVMSVLGCS